VGAQLSQSSLPLRSAADPAAQNGRACIIGNQAIGREKRDLVNQGVPLHSYRHPHPAVAVDIAIFTVREGHLEVLLIERGVEPYKGAWSLPGGFVRISEDLPSAAARELKEETGIGGAYLRQVGAFGDPERDPRERVISVAYFAILSSDVITIKAGTDAAAARWWPFSELPPLGFDHKEIIASAHQALVNELPNSSVAFQFLGEEFTLSELQRVHEAIRGEGLDKRNFRKWVAALGAVRATGRLRRAGPHRPAELYRLRRRSLQGNSARHQ
jgi:8-oxo-dGTP diphosphatase